YLWVLFVIVQDYLFQQLPAIARQEIGLLLFAALTYAMLDPRLRRGTRMTLIAVLALGVVVAHYGTAYYTIALFALALVLEAGRAACVRLLAHDHARAIRGAALWPLMAAPPVTSPAPLILHRPAPHPPPHLPPFPDHIP